MHVSQRFYRLRSGWRFLAAALSFLMLFPALAQRKPTSPQTLSGLTRFKQIADDADSTRRMAALHRYWQQLVAKGSIPVVEGQTATFLYRGSADSVQWHGDFDGWGSDKKLSTRGRRLTGTDLWYWQTSFPEDARFDYKVVLNSKDWILDPANARQQWGGSGPNSFLAMPAWRPKATTIAQAGIKGGRWTSATLPSQALGYAVSYRVYLPAGYESGSRLPVLYVTDGQEYSDNRLGALGITLDNLIATRKIQPLIAVCVDPRNPADTTQNRRMTELTLNEQYLRFLTAELIPAIDSQYATQATADARGILGTSLGGLNAAFVGAKASRYFHLIGIQSPAFWFKPAIYELYEQSPRLPLKIYMSTGASHDTEEGARRMKQILTAKGYELRYKEVNEGHSWGNWRNLIDEALLYLFPLKKS